MPEALNIIDQTYSGTAMSVMLTRAVEESDTINKGVVMVEDGIKKSRTLPRIEVSDFMQKRKPTPTSQGNVDVDGVTLTPRDIMLYYEFNPRDYEQHWYAEQLSKTLLPRELPQTAEAFMIMQTMKRLNKFFEYAWWRSRISYDPDGTGTTAASVGAETGDEAYLYFDGLIKKALDADDIIAVPSPVALTVNNIRDKMTAAYNLVPKAKMFKYGKGGLKFIMSYADKNKYDEALRTDSFKNTDTSEKGYERFRGYEVEVVAGMPENTFFVCFGKPDIDSDLWIGLNSNEDQATLELKRLQNNSELFYVKGLFKVDTQLAFADQIVIYTTQVA